MGTINTHQEKASEKRVFLIYIEFFANIWLKQTSKQLKKLGFLPAAAGKYRVCTRARTGGPKSARRGRGERLMIPHETEAQAAALETRVAVVHPGALQVTGKEAPAPAALHAIPHAI